MSGDDERMARDMVDVMATVGSGAGCAAGCLKCLADALIAAGFGDVTSNQKMTEAMALQVMEWTTRSVKAETQVASLLKIVADTVAGLRECADGMRQPGPRRDDLTADAFEGLADEYETALASATPAAEGGA